MYDLKVLDNSGKSRVASTINFPYTDIGDAIAVAEGLLKGGGTSLSRDQLAAAMGLSPGGGGFNVKVSTARAFGIIESAGGKYTLTEIGFEIADPGRQKEAMITAFLNVELYRKVFDEFRGKRLPPRPHGLENAFVSFGVSPKQAVTARLAFDKSARAAGFFPNGDEDRLVEPFGFVKTSQDREEEAAEGLAPTVSTPTPAPTPVAGLHRSILGMLDELPPAKSNWSKEEQADWLQALATMFQVIYKSEDKGDIVVSYESKA
jgi:hypothetical protein